MRLWTDTRWTEAPMSIYRLGPAVVLGGTVITPQARHRLRDDHVGFRRALKGSVRQPEIVLANSLQGLKFFGHWLGDDCTAFEAFRDHPALWSVRRHAWSDMAYYEGAFRQDWQEQDVMQTDNLILLRDLGFGRRKTERYRTLRGRLREHVRDRQASGKIVFIRRGASAKKREITNWDELRQRLEDRGISIVTPEGDTASFVQNILDASLVMRYMPCGREAGFLCCSRPFSFIRRRKSGCALSSCTAAWSSGALNRMDSASTPMRCCPWWIGCWR